MPRAVEDDVLVRLIGDDDGIGVLEKPLELANVVASENHASGIVW